MKTTLIKHETNRNALSPYQVSELALELARLPDGSINRASFSDCCDQAFDTLAKLQARITSLNQQLPSELQ